VLAGLPNVIWVQYTLQALAAFVTVPAVPVYSFQPGLPGIGTDERTNSPSPIASQFVSF
jgi:hypothetical protein